MKNASFLRSHNSFCKHIGLRVALIITCICLFYTIYPNYIGATQITNKPIKDPLDQDSDILPFEYMDEANQTITNTLKYRLHIGSYGSVLETIATLPKEEKNRTEIIGLKAAALIGKDDFASAMKEYNLLKNRNDTSSQTFSTIANMLLKKKKPFAAMMACQSGLMRDITSATLLYQMGYAYDSMDKTRTALAYYKGAVAAKNASHKFKKQTDIEKAIAVAYYKLNDYEKANNALKDNDKDIHLGIQLIINAKYLASKGSFDKAISLLDKAEKSSRYLEADITKMQLLILNAKPKEAIALSNDLDLVLNRSGFSDVLKLTKSLALLSDGKAEASLNLLQELQHPEKIPNIHMLKAIAYFSTNNKKKTIEELKQTSLPYSELATFPAFENSLNQPSIGPDIGLAFFCLDQKFYDQAINLANKAAEKSKNSVLSNFILAECYLRTDKFPSAIKELQKLGEAYKGSYAIQFYLGQVYAKAGMMNEARKAYESLTKERPDFIMANLVYGKLLSDYSKWDEARKVYETGLNFMPDSPQLQMSLGWVLAHLNELDSLANLLQIIEKNKTIEPASILHLTGWHAYKNDNFSKAEELLTKAIESAPGDPEICFHLGMTMMKTGKKDMAKNLLQQSLLFEEQRDRLQDTINKVLSQNE